MASQFRPVGGAREVPLHPQLVEIGSPKFVSIVSEERLFLIPDAEGDIAGPWQGLKNRLSEAARQYVDDPGVSPNHSWRHRFRTVTTDAGVSGNVIDAIGNWSTKNVGERHGSASLKARADAIIRLPWIVIRPKADWRDVRFRAEKLDSVERPELVDTRRSAWSR